MGLTIEWKKEGLRLVFLVWSIFQLCADKVNQLFINDKTIKILDIGCGDGLVGEALVKRGFKNMTGLDISGKMVKLVKVECKDSST